MLVASCRGRQGDTCQEPDRQALIQLRNAREKGLLDVSVTFQQLPVLQLFFPFGNPMPAGNFSGSSGPNVTNVTEHFECVVPIPPGASSDKWVPCLNITERQQLQQDVIAASSNASEPSLAEYLATGSWDPAGKWAIPMDYWNDMRCNCPNCADEEELYTAVAYAVQGSGLTLADNFTDYVLNCETCPGCPDQNQCGAVVDCDPDALRLVPSCAQKLQEDGWNIDHLYDCGDGFKIPKLYVNDSEYCDCPDCSDEDKFTCSTCNAECPTECGYWALCGSNSSFTLNPICHGANFNWDARAGYKACNNGWTIPADYWDDEFYCDCPDCEDESTITCQECGGCPNASAACGEFVECFTSESILPTLNPYCILPALGGWSPGSIISCNASDPDAWNISSKYINDGYCDCGNCEDEDEWTCANCSVGCPKQCGDSVQCVANEANFKACGSIPDLVYSYGSGGYGGYGPGSGYGGYSPGSGFGYGGYSPGSGYGGYSPGSGYGGYSPGGHDDANTGFDDGDDSILDDANTGFDDGDDAGAQNLLSNKAQTRRSKFFVCENGWTIPVDWYDDKDLGDLE